MTNKFLEPIRTFAEITSENLKWVGSKIRHQYFLSTLRDIEKLYPELHTEVEAFIKHLDAIFYGITDEDCPDFVEAPEEYERTNIDRGYRCDPNTEEDPEYNAKFEATLQKLKEHRQALMNIDPFKDSDEGLNEPDYPYDTEPSA